MRFVPIAARILLGLLFTFAGLSGPFMGSPPPLPGLAGTLNMAFYHSHWNLVIGLAQAVAGILLLVNRYVTLALIILGAFLYNSLAFHALTMPSTLPIPLVVLAVWIVACWPYRKDFGALFTAKRRTDKKERLAPTAEPSVRSAV